MSAWKAGSVATSVSGIDRHLLAGQPFGRHRQPRHLLRREGQRGEKGDESECDDKGRTAHGGKVMGAGGG